ncbi:RloB-like protein [compost metagenome]
MGTDNLFHRRKGSGASKLSRRGPTKKALPFYLIVCEGEKTEPNYFNELRNFERISTVYVKVCGECGSAPISVVEYAVGLYERMVSEGNSVEGVFCVFDRDNHASFHAACALIDRTQVKGVPIHTIYSIPCFEYWLILHFQYHRSPFVGTGRASVAGMVLRELAQHFKYQKGASGIYEQLKPLQNRAIENAKRAVADFEDTGNDNPLTYVHDLVEKLLEHTE